MKSQMTSLYEDKVSLLYSYLNEIITFSAIQVAVFDQSWPNLFCICGLPHTWACILSMTKVNTLRPRQNGRLFADDTFKRIFLNENAKISIKISLKFVPKGPINNNPALVQIMAW